MDFGRKYMSRVFIYESTFFGGYLFFVVVLVLYFFGLINFKLSLMIIFIACFDITVVLGIVLLMLNLGAIVND